MTQHASEVKAFYPAKYRYYTARCTCGWPGGSSYPTREAAEAAVNHHISTTTNHPAVGA
ncbi:MAG: hypothetical protein JO272_13590 [Pseudonocardiales bacterium]|nr:hypothetical protein [Pseudonocardiales bacterium]